MKSNNLPTILTLPTVRLKDERSPIFLDVVRWMVSWKLRRHFAQIYVQDMQIAQRIAVDTGAIFALNHISNWDFRLFFELSELMSKHAYVFVPEQKTQHQAFLRWCGAIPLDTDNPTLAHAQIRQTHKLCSEPTQFWIFPQHQPYPTNKTNLHFQSEVVKLSTHLELPVIPVSVQYLYRDGDKPSAYISFQDPLPYHCSVLDIEGSVKRGLTSIDNFHVGKDKDGFKPLYHGGSNKKASLTSRMLSYFAEWKLSS